MDSRTYSVFKQSPLAFWEMRHTEKSAPLDSANLQLALRNDLHVKQSLFSRYPDALRVPIGLTPEDRRNLTHDALSQGRPVIGAILHCEEQAVAGCDLAMMRGDDLCIVDVSAAASLNDGMNQRLAFAAWGAQKAGFKIGEAAVVHVDKDARPAPGRSGIGWLAHVDLTAAVKCQVSEVEGDLRAALVCMSNPARPTPSNAELLSSSKEDFTRWFPKLSQPDSIGCFLRVKRRSLLSWSAMGIFKIHEINDADLDKNQIRQKASLSSGGAGSAEAIQGFLGRIQFPVLLYDFETMASAIPVFPKCRPYEQVPFMFSAIRIDVPGGSPKAHTFIAPANGSDPRDPLLDKFMEISEGVRSSVAYHSTFEKTALKSCISATGRGEKWLADFLHTDVDLYEPFRRGDFYDIRQEGSASLKKVALALGGGDAYSKMEIGDGASAQLAFWNALEGRASEKFVRDKLKVYCDWDTQVMGVILNNLEKRYDRAHSRFGGISELRRPEFSGEESSYREPPLDTIPDPAMTTAVNASAHPMAVGGRRF